LFLNIYLSIRVSTLFITGCDIIHELMDFKILETDSKGSMAYV